MSKLIIALVQNKLAGLLTSKDGTERAQASLESEVEENKVRLNFLEEQIKECTDFLKESNE